MEMEKTTVDLRTLSDSQKAEFLKHVGSFLQQRAEEERYYRSFSISSLEKNGMELSFDLTDMGEQNRSNVKNTIEKIKNLKTETKILLLEIDELKKTANAKAAVLESEVNALRDQVKSLKVLINWPEPSTTLFPHYQWVLS